LQLKAHYYENPIYVFLFWELRGLSPSFHIHVSVSDLYISRIGPHIFLQKNREIGTGGRAIPFLGIFVSNFRYCIFTVRRTGSKFEAGGYDNYRQK
jgi:hypothetical protein